MNSKQPLACKLRDGPQSTVASINSFPMNHSARITQQSRKRFTVARGTSLFVCHDPQPEVGGREGSFEQRWNDQEERRRDFGIIEFPFVLTPVSKAREGAAKLEASASTAAQLSISKKVFAIPCFVSLGLSLCHVQITCPKNEHIPQ